MNPLPPLPRHGASMRARAFWRRIGRLEHERLEFKRSVNHIREAVAAMAMSEGGLIVVGVSDERELLGWPLDQETLDRISAVAYETGVDDVEIRAITVGRAPLTIVLVPAVRDRIVTTSDGRLLRRIGSANLPLRGEALARFVRGFDERAARAVGSPRRAVALCGRIRTMCRWP